MALLDRDPEEYAPLFDTLLINVSEFFREITANFMRFRKKMYIVFFIRDISERKKYVEELNAEKAQSELYPDLMCHDINNMKLNNFKESRSKNWDIRPQGFAGGSIKAWYSSSREVMVCFAS